MITIATIFDFNSDEFIRGIWEKLKVVCSMSGILETPLPHFSWQIAENYDLEELKNEMDQLAQNSRSFKVCATDIGLFVKPSPVLCLGLSVSSDLLNMHQNIWENISKHAEGLNNYYSPGLWQPHITLAYGDICQKKMRCIFDNLPSSMLNFNIKVENFYIILMVRMEF